MGVADKPRLTLWNKLDLLPEGEQEHVKARAEGTEGLTVSASARTGEGLDNFVACLEAVVPYSRGDLLSRVRELGACDSEEFTDAGTLIKARVPKELLNRLEPYFTAEFKEQFEFAEMTEMGEEEAAAWEEERNWKLLAKKRTKANAVDEAML